MSRAITRRFTLASTLAAAIGLDAVAAEEGDAASRAPFGLTWGASAEEVRKLGITLTVQDDKGRYGQSFAATGLSRVLSDVETVLLSFGHRDRLFRVVAIGKPQGPDPYGGAVLSRYTELSKLLSERYGPGRETDQRDTQMWKAPNEYVMSLRQGRANRYTIFQTARVEIELSMRAAQSDTAFYVAIFTSRPGEAEFKADNRNRERDTL